MCKNESTASGPTVNAKCEYKHSNMSRASFPLGMGGGVPPPYFSCFCPHAFSALLSKTSLNRIFRLSSTVGHFQVLSVCAQQLGFTSKMFFVLFCLFFLCLFILGSALHATRRLLHCPLIGVDCTWSLRGRSAATFWAAKTFKPHCIVLIF